LETELIQRLLLEKIRILFNLNLVNKADKLKRNEPSKIPAVKNEVLWHLFLAIPLAEKMQSSLGWFTDKSVNNFQTNKDLLDTISHITLRRSQTVEPRPTGRKITPLPLTNGRASCKLDSRSSRYTFPEDSPKKTQSKFLLQEKSGVFNLALIKLHLLSLKDPGSEYISLNTFSQDLSTLGCISSQECHQIFETMEPSSTANHRIQFELVVDYLTRLPLTANRGVDKCLQRYLQSIMTHHLHKILGNRKVISQTHQVGQADETPLGIKSADLVSPIIAPSPPSLRTQLTQKPTVITPTPVIAKRQISLKVDSALFSSLLDEEGNLNHRDHSSLNDFIARARFSPIKFLKQAGNSKSSSASN
jgi:hypothetical protein